MKVLERKEAGWRKQTCTGYGNGGKGCGSVLLLDLEDVYQTAHTDLGGCRETFTTFRCPVCHVETDIKDPPLPVRDAAARRPNGIPRLETEK